MSTIHARFNFMGHADGCSALEGGECDGDGCRRVYFGVDVVFHPEPRATLRERILLARHAAMHRARDHVEAQNGIW